MLTNYVEFDEVRSALGVNDLELPDQVLALPVYQIGLMREIQKISGSLAASFSSIRQKVHTARTAEEDALYSAVRLFSVYLVASQVGVSLANFTPKSVGDGKATVSRFSSDPYKSVLAEVAQARDRYRREVQDAITTIAGGNVAAPQRPTLAAAATRLTDPVTGS